MSTSAPVLELRRGRQLFVDDFLVQSSTLTRTFHQPVPHPANPVLVPETRLESNLDHADPAWQPASGACPFDDGVFYDPADGLFKMWYSAGHRYATALAYSRDGIHWERPALDVVPGTNAVIGYEPDFSRDSFSPWLDHSACEAGERFKAFLYTRSQQHGDGGWVCTSPDGIHWKRRARLSAAVGDNTSLFFNGLRGTWALSVRRGEPGRGRVRFYAEHADFLGLADGAATPTFWARADADDPPDPDVPAEIPGLTQLYGVSAVGYESLLLGLFSIHYGPHNRECAEGGFPKLTQIKVGYSRDGLQWERPDRRVFIAASKRDGAWDRAYLRAAGGGCLVVRDQLYFYYCGFSGIAPDGTRHMYAGGSTHLATLRRDGFASLDAGPSGGTMTTRPFRWDGAELFVNADTSGGELRVEVLDGLGQTLESFSLDRCRPITADLTRVRVQWDGALDLSSLRGRETRLRFHLSGGRLYAFWMSPDRSGASHGFVAAGGPGFGGATDTEGSAAEAGSSGVTPASDAVGRYASPAGRLADGLR